jgi:hypothetical protein
LALALLLAGPLLRAFSPSSALESPIAGLATAPLDLDENVRIGKYIPVLAVTERLLKADSDSPELLRSTAAIWVKETDSGVLEPLLPDSNEQQLLDGPKGEIFVAANRLASRLHSLASSEYLRGDYWNTAEDNVLSAQTLRSMRYGDFTTESYFSYHMRGALASVQLLVGKLTHSQREVLRNQISTLRTDPKTFAVMTGMERNVEVVQRARYQAMQQAIVGMPGEDKVIIDQPQDTSARLQAAQRIEDMVDGEVTLTLRALS